MRESLQLAEAVDTLRLDELQEDSDRRELKE